MVLVTLPEIEVERGRQWVLVKHAIAASWIRKSKDIYGLMHIADRALKPQTSMDGRDNRSWKYVMQIILYAIRHFRIKI